MRSEMIPLAERLRYSQWYRLAVFAFLLGLAVIAPGVLGIPLRDAAAGVGLLIGAAAVGEMLWRRWPGLGRPVFSSLLLLDGVFLAWAVHASGGSGSAIRFLTIVHVIVATLLASYRTGLKIALWHSILAFIVVNAEEAGLIGKPTADTATTGEFSALLAFAGPLWVVALATAVFSAVNERELRRRRYDLEALTTMTAKLHQAKDAEDVLEALTRSLADTFDFPRVAAVLGGPDGVELLAATGAAEGAARVGPADAILRQAWHKDETLLVRELDPQLDPWTSALFPGSQHLVVVPLLTDGRPVGAVIAEHELRGGSRIEHRVVSTVNQFVSDATLALANVRLVERITHMAQTDGLTQIANRGTFDARLDAALARAARLGEPVSLVLVDIDHFKQLNDTHGHQVGDDVLRAVAAALSAECRGSDLAARYGGEEFAVIIPGCPADGALKAADRFRTRLATAGTKVPVTASAGVATYPRDASTAADLIRAADSALYGSKRSGRDRATQVPALPVH